MEQEIFSRMLGAAGGGGVEEEDRADKGKSQGNRFFTGNVIPRRDNMFPRSIGDDGPLNSPLSEVITLCKCAG